MNQFWPNSDETIELLGNARDGNTAARERLLSRHRDALRRMIDMRMDPRIQGRVDASDIVQEVLMDASRRLAEYLDHPVLPFFLWLRQIAKDRVVDAYRQHRGSAMRSVDRERSIFLRAEDNDSTSDLAAQLSDHTITPAAAATLAEIRGHFERVLNQLDEIDREVIVLRHYEHLSNKEVAQALEIAEHAASMRYLRAVRRLGKQLRRNGPPDQELT